MPFGLLRSWGKPLAKGGEGPAGGGVLDHFLQACLIANGLELGLQRGERRRCCGQEVPAEKNYSVTGVSCGSGTISGMSIGTTNSPLGHGISNGADLLLQERLLRQRRFGKRRRRGAKRALQQFKSGIRGRSLLGLRQTLNPVKKRYRYIVDDKGRHAGNVPASARIKAFGSQAKA